MMDYWNHDVNLIYFFSFRGLRFVKMTSGSDRLYEIDVSRLDKNLRHEFADLKEEKKISVFGSQLRGLYLFTIIFAVFSVTEFAFGTHLDSISTLGAGYYGFFQTFQLGVYAIMGIVRSKYIPSKYSYGYD